jgi:hypothetical protein
MRGRRPARCLPVGALGPPQPARTQATASALPRPSNREGSSQIARETKAAIFVVSMGCASSPSQMDGQNDDLYRVFHEFGLTTLTRVRARIRGYPPDVVHAVQAGGWRACKSPRFFPRSAVHSRARGCLLPAAQDYGGAVILPLSNNSLGICPVSSDSVRSYVQIICAMRPNPCDTPAHGFDFKLERLSALRPVVR